MFISKLNSMFEYQSSTFATHIPLLRFVGENIKTVLELGAGQFSTPLFLDKNYYPKVEKVLTIESDHIWADKMKNNDSRHNMIVIPEPIESFLSTLNFNDFDLIFVDNSAYRERRCETLKYVSENTKRSLVVAHDFEMPMYREAASKFDYSIIDDRHETWTALLWNTKND